MDSPPPAHCDKNTQPVRKTMEMAVRPGGLAVQRGLRVVAPDGAARGALEDVLSGISV